MSKNANEKIYYSIAGEYLYKGNMKEGDREATANEIEYWNTYGSTIQKDKNEKNAENTAKYTEALNAPLVCGEYFVIADWINTYTNTYTYAKKQEETDSATRADIVVFDRTGKLVTITITCLADFEPYYNTVAEEWARITDLRNKYMVEIQNATAPKDIVISYEKVLAE